MRYAVEIEKAKNNYSYSADVPDLPARASAARRPDFLARLRAIYGGKKLAVSGAELLARDRDR